MMFFAGVAATLLVELVLAAVIIRSAGLVWIGGGPGMTLGR